MKEDSQEDAKRKDLLRLRKVSRKLRFAKLKLVVILVMSTDCYLLCCYIGTLLLEQLTKSEKRNRIGTNAVMEQTFRTTSIVRVALTPAADPSKYNAVIVNSLTFEDMAAYIVSEDGLSETSPEEKVGLKDSLQSYGSLCF
uniref:Uncharacterized protein n=1 Tax=Ditylenchus dipsaci TaxID=166011 RepID=A0A915CK89_9BILA